MAVTLVDAGPLVALLDRRDPDHARCQETAASLPAEPLRTTWPCWTEAMYLLGKTGGHNYQDALWALWRSSWVRLHDLTEGETKRADALMAQYRDTPMDLADASLVALAERLDTTRVFSLDTDVLVYRLADGRAFEVVPV